MPDYLSPATFLTQQGADPQSTGAIGMLGGALAGRNDDIAMGMVQRGFRDSDLANLMAQEDYKIKQDEVPTKAAQNAAERTKADEFMQTSPDRLSAVKSTYGQQVNDNKHKEFAQELDRKINVSNELSAINKAIGDSSTIPPHMMEYLDTAWKKAGLPQLPPDGMQARKVLQNFAQMADQRIPLMERERDRAADLAKAAIGANASMYGADTHLKGVEYAAKMNLKGDEARLEAIGMDRVLGRLAQKAAQVGLEGLTGPELEVYRGGIAAKAATAASQSVALKMMQIIQTDPKATPDYGKLFNQALDEASGGTLGRIDKLLGKSGEGAKKTTKVLDGVTYEEVAPGKWKVVK